jgi:hypothetical protein
MAETVDERHLREVVSFKARRILGIVPKPRRIILKEPSGDMAVRTQDKETEAKKAPQS